MNHGRRRPHEQDDYGHGDDRSATKKVKNEDDRISTSIMTLGDQAQTSVEVNIDQLARLLESEIHYKKPEILQTLLEVVTVFPEKCSVYSTLVGLLNAKNYNFGGEYVEHLEKSFKNHLKNGNWTMAQYTLRFICDLVNCHVVSVTSLLEWFDTFMQGTSTGSSVPQVRRDWFVYAILYCLPWVGRELYDKKEQTVERLMIKIDIYMKRRKTEHVNLLRVWSSDNPHPQEEYLDCLWAQVGKMKLDGWSEKHINRPYLTFDTILSEALHHNLTMVTLPPHHDKMVYPMPSVVFRMYDYTDVPQGTVIGTVLPGAHAIERFLIEQDLKDIIRKCRTQRKECAQALLDYKHNTHIPLEYVICEVMLGEMFRLPTSEFLEIFYGSTLIELCKISSDVFPRVLAQATEILFHRLDTMNVSGFDRFASWFSYHLNNFQFLWDFEDWAKCVSYGKEHPKWKFLQELTEKSLRLSYYERITVTFAKIFQLDNTLMPPRTDPLNKYLESEKEKKVLGKVESQKLELAIRSKASVGQITAILKECPNRTQEDETYNALPIDVFSQTVFSCGSKSLTHLQALIQAYQPVFKSLVGDSEEAKLCVLKAAYQVWKNDSKLLAVGVDFLLKYQIVECSTVANWIFTKDMMGDFTRAYLWEILHSTIRKMNNHVKRLSDAREKLHRVDKVDRNSEKAGYSGNGKADTNIVTEDEISKIEEKLDGAQSDQKCLFLIVFQRFIMILSAHIAQSNEDGKPFNTPWYHLAIGRLQEMFMKHGEQVFQYTSTLETLLFTPVLDQRILEVFHQFQALRG